MDSRSGRPLRRADFSGNRAVATWRQVAEQAGLQTIEFGSAAFGFPVSPEVLKHLVEHRQRPATIEESLRRVSIDWLMDVLLLGILELKRHENVATAPLQGSPMDQIV